MLGPVTMMHVPINDRSSKQFVLSCVQNSYSDIINEAESHRFISFGMMPRRSHGAKCVLYLFGHDHVNCFDDSSRGKKRYIV